MAHKIDVNEIHATQAAVVLFTGMDRIDYELECESGEQARFEAEKLSEIGCHCIAVVSMDKKTGIGREPYSCD